MEIKDASPNVSQTSESTHLSNSTTNLKLDGKAGTSMVTVSTNKFQKTQLRQGILSSNDSHEQRSQDGYYLSSDTVVPEGMPLSNVTQKPTEIG